MKPWDQSVPAATREVDGDGSVPEEIELDTTDLDGVGAIPGMPMQTAEIDLARDRRITLTSMVSAEIAAQMRSDQDEEAAPSRDPAAPEPERPAARGEDEDQQTRRVGESDRQRLGSGSNKTAEPDGIARRRQRAAALIDRARAALDDGDLTTAVDAAEGALHDADEAPPPGIVEVIEPARPLLARVFAAYVGSLAEVPVLAPRASDIARERLGERERALIARIDGLRTLEELFDGSGLGSTEALRIAARLIRSGAIRVI
ncbi:MAG TPA: hypothetical protein VMT03_10605 [Polyangia bacterium]|nr:hypothetical protein [Polyangia bacterium]